MKPRVALLLALVIAAFAGSTDAAEKPTVIELWPGAVPGDNPQPRGYYGPLGKEMVRAPENSPTRDAQWLTNVTRPSITVFRAPKRKNTGTAMIICPGGGYWNLAWDLEGTEVAEWLNSVGITGVVLKYRVPRREGQPEALPAPGPLLDAQRAVSLVRSHAAEWGIRPDRIGIVGFSAGGHLAVSTATNWDKRGYPMVDAADAVSCRPDFAVGVYSGYFAEKDNATLSPLIRIPKDTPPIMLVHTSDDTVSAPENSTLMYQALRKAGVPAEMHIYATGGHGFGVRKSKGECATWTERCLAWLRGRGLLDRPE